MSDGEARRPRRDEVAAPPSAARSEPSGTAGDGEARRPRRDEVAAPPSAARSEPENADRGRPPQALRYVTRSDRGLLRTTNQDSVFAGDRLLVIADGMGGHAAGDTASRIVVTTFAPLNARPPSANPLADLARATVEANRSIARMVADHPDLEGMGTTVTAMLFDGDRLGLVHVGDSRAYLYRAGLLHQLTHDDTFVQSLVDDGRITEGEAHLHPQRNLLLRALNGTDLDPSLTLRDARCGDRYLLCSDGLSGVVGAEPIADALAGPDLDQVADRLIQLALRAGAPDNVTVVVADVIDTGAIGACPAPPPRDGDPMATGPIDQLTREMPRVPLPPIPEEPAERGELLPSEDPDEFEGDIVDDDGGVDDDETAGEDTDAGGPGARRGAEGVDGAAAGGGRDGGRRATNRRPGGSGRTHRRPRWHRHVALAVAIAALLGAALAGATLWVRNQYFVGEHNGMVAVFRGVNGSLLGARFASFQENSCAGATDCRPMELTDLQPAARHQVEGGIQAASLDDARSVVQRLAAELLPPCPDPAAPDRHAPATTDRPAPAAATLTSPRAEGTGLLGSPARTLAATDTGRLRGPGIATTVTRTVTATPLAPIPAMPGTNCRAVP